VAVKTLIHVYTRDAQGYTERETFGASPSAFGPLADNPVAADIETYINDTYGTGKISTSIVTAYSVEIIEDAPTSVGGDGSVATAIALKTRNQIGNTADVDGWELRIPGLNKANMSFDPTNANSVVTSIAPFPDYRVAAASLGFRDPTGVVTDVPAEADIAQTGVAFNGKRGPKRPR